MVNDGGAATRRVLVTGGTGSIGRALVRTLTHETDLDVSFQFGSSMEVARQLELETGAAGIQIDLAQPFELPRNDFHILINAAAVLLTKTLAHEVTEDELIRTTTVNLLAPFRMCQQCLPYMMQSRYGRIVNIGSIYAERGCTENSSYNVSKHGLLGLTRSLAKEYAEFGIAVNQIDPSAVESEMMERIARGNVDRARASSVQGYLDGVRDAIPVGRLASVQDIVDGVLYLIRQSGFVTGVALPIDGGVIC